MSPSRFCGWLALAAFLAAPVTASDLPDDPAQQRSSGVRPFYVEWRGVGAEANAGSANAPGRAPPSHFRV